jgi:beta-mannosidase
MKKNRELSNPFLRGIGFMAFFLLLLSEMAFGQPYPDTETTVNSLSLNGVWQVTWTDGGHGPRDMEVFRTVSFHNDPEKYIDVPVPMELHKALQQKGIIDDPDIGINSLKARWVEEQYWQYRTSFTPPDASLGKENWLYFEQLDLNAHIYLNGVLIGHHMNAHLPCKINVTGNIKKGENELVVALESGLHYVAEKPGEQYATGLDTWLNKRIWLRKPQYQFSWDWNPRLINVGITGNVIFHWADKLRLDQTSVYSLLDDDLKRATVTVRPFIENVKAGTIIRVEANIKEANISIKKEFAGKEGLEVYPVEFEINNPKLWWPHGQGEQNLYSIDIRVYADGVLAATATKSTGIRRVEVDQSPHPVEGRYFIIKVNNRPVFLKGADWVPADMIYSSVTHERLSALVDLALGANFNMLRIWGGGTWAGNDLLELCDKKGIVVWHDMLFACSKYPGDDPEFMENVKKEVTWGVREFAHHPSLAVWCGNNEIEWINWNNGSGKVNPDYALFHHYIPVILKEEDPNRYYQPSSPLSPDNEFPNSPTSGDQHPWGVSLFEDGTNIWAYRNYIDRFPNEGGVLGMSSPKTLRQFLADDQEYIRSFQWEHHDNLVNFWDGKKGAAYEMVDYWFGKSYKEFNFDEYAYASALIQAEGLTEYISNYRRRMFSSSSAIFWMYNDSWPVVHGWTIVDYYLRKKLAYYPVKRAFNPISVVITSEDDKINFYGVNDSPADWSGQMRYGLFATKGGLPIDEKADVKLPANHSTLLKSIKKEEWTKLGLSKHGAFASLTSENGNPVNQYKLLLTKFKDLDLAIPKIAVTRKGDFAEFTSSAFVWGASIDVDGEAVLPDNCFDLIPGVPYKIAWPKDKKLPVVIRTGNDLFR